MPGRLASFRASCCSTMALAMARWCACSRGATVSAAEFHPARVRFQRHQDTAGRGGHRTRAAGAPTQEQVLFDELLAGGPVRELVAELVFELRLLDVGLAGLERGRNVGGHHDVHLHEALACRPLDEQPVQRVLPLGLLQLQAHRLQRRRDIRRSYG